MYTIFMMLILIMFLILFLASISFILSNKSIMDQEKNSPFECGFDPKTSARMPFSLQFFLIALIFLIFDVEIALILPAILIKNWSNPSTWLLTLLFFILILLLGLYHEWNQGALNWAN